MTNKYKNFSIIAHIDHGKSTLADRILEMTGSLTSREMKSQTLDSMDIERERGITIKLNAVQLQHKGHTLHLIDTPGHVDFTYEVSRSLAACEGAILVVDSTQGVEAQTIANVYLAMENDLEIIPVLNKVDLPAADVERVKKQIEDVLGIDCSDAPLISAKTGLNVDKVLEQILERIPSAPVETEKPLKGLVFDSYFDDYKGAVILVRVKEGKVRIGDKIQFFANKKTHQVSEIWVSTPKTLAKKELQAGEVGFISCSIKDIQDISVGDTIFNIETPIDAPLPGYKKMNPMVYSGVFPIDTSRFEDLREAIEKLKLSDSSFTGELETSQALGHGFRCGFLGLLHMDVIKERIEREFNIQLIITAPSVQYDVHMTDQTIERIKSPADFPDKQRYSVIEEPYVRMKTMLPEEYVGSVMDLCQKHRGRYLDLIFLDDKMRELVYEMPLAEIIWDFFDSIKSVSRGYATLDYELIGYKPSNLVKMDVLVAGDPIDALSAIVHKDSAFYLGRELTKKLKDIIPRHQFEVAVQAAIGSKIIARETIKAYRKDVTAKCYGGDISRKKKLLQKQKDGKEKMKAVGRVNIPQDAFVAVLKADKE